LSQDSKYLTGVISKEKRKAGGKFTFPEKYPFPVMGPNRIN
jgi:hypothetical protein